MTTQLTHTPADIAALHAQIEVLKQENAKLKAENKELKAQLDTFRKGNEGGIGPIPQVY